jgi:undecaprenyl phosphate N,N'-diacetylbacillosamine 1-phosphate transferase
MLKRTLDLILFLLVSIITFPVFAACSILIKIDSRGPVFFRQKRLGKNLVEFNIYKFRTMITGAQEVGTGLSSYVDDPRITRTGKILRKLSIDELPQLINILFGQMSFVGPRPPVVGEIAPNNSLTVDQLIRFKTKPGLTGLAQINGRNSLSWPEKIEYDNLYVERFREIGIFLDIKILIVTVWKVLSRKNVFEVRGKND